MLSDLDSLLVEARAAAEEIMTEACTITRAGELTFDPDAGYSDPTGDTVYAGMCRVQQARIAGPSSSLVGGAELTLDELDVWIPISSTVIEVDDVVTVTAARYDPQLVGRSYRVAEVPAASQKTSRRLRVDYLTR